MSFLDEARAIGSTSDPRFAALVLGALDQADVTWESLDLPIDGGRLECSVFADSLKIDGCRIVASALTELEIADRLGAVLMTPAISDAVYLAAGRHGRQIVPQPRPITSSVAGMIAHSMDVDAAAQGASFVADPGKDWCQYRGKIVTYGWHADRAWSQAAGVPIGPAVTQGLSVVQGPFAGHGLRHVDYSQTVRLVARRCRWNGQIADLDDLYRAGRFAAGAGAIPSGNSPSIVDATPSAAAAVLAIGLGALAWLFSRRRRL
jgi:hypothetical protein